MKITIAYIEEPPFYWTGPDHSVTGADIELAGGAANWFANIAESG